MKTNKYYPCHSEKSINDFADLLYSCAREFGSKDCYRYLRRKTEYKVSFSDFAKTVNGLGSALCEMGVNKGHTAIIGEKCYEWLSAYFAAIIFGGVAVPLDKELAEDQIRSFINFADCEAVVYTEKYRGVFEGHESEMPAVKCYICISAGAPVSLTDEPAVAPETNHMPYGDTVKWGHYLNVKRGLPEVVKKQDTEKMSVILFTSGTTGTSKGVMLSQKNIISNITEALKIVRVDSKDVLVSVLPLHHTYEMTAGILAAFAVGATVCINDNIKNTTRDFKYFQPTVITLVPLFVNTVYKKIMEGIRKKGMEKTVNGLIKTDKVLRRVGIDLRKQFFSQITEAFGGRLNRIVCGGAPLNPEMVEKFASFGITIAEGYGITECSPVIAVAPFENVRLHSCGLVLPNLQCYIDRDDPRDETGEIVVKGDSIMLGYYKNPEATAEVLDSRGWFRTGDCGYMDKDNYLYITGRKKNVIVLNNGKNVFPEEIEEYLERVDFIKEVTVVGRRSTEDDTINVTAIIYPDYDSLYEKGIIGDMEVESHFKKAVVELNKNIASFKQIRGVEIRKTPFPKTTTQKIQRHKIDKE
ncbi:MAG: AMP-binding protein [Clostridia bacterium]|nr:AMP-binding protein [Clostridia bacterium]